MNLDVICVGSVTIDTIAVVPRLPGSDGRALASAFVVAGGGPAATAAVTLARLGMRVGICGVIGDDADGEFVRTDLEAEGVDTEWLIVRPGTSTPRSSIVVSSDSGERMIITQRATEPLPAEIPVHKASWLHADQTGLAAVRRAIGQAGSTRISVDAGNAIDAPDLNGIDLFVPTVESLRARYGSASTDEAVAAAFADGARRVVATDGANGAVIGSTDGVEFIPAFATEVVSSLGAGDVFHGALLAGVVRGTPIAESVRQANATAALSCRSIDGRSAIPTRAELDAFLNRSTHPVASSTTQSLERT